MFNKFLERNKIKNKDKQLNKLTKELIDLTLEYNIKLNKIYDKIKLLQMEPIELKEKIELIPTNIPNTYQIKSTFVVQPTQLPTHSPPETSIQNPVQPIVYVLDRDRNKPLDKLYTPLKTNIDDIKSIDIYNSMNNTPITIHSLSTLSDTSSSEILENKKNDFLEYNNIEMTHSLPTNINISKFIQSNIFLDEQIIHI
jgi:hypothetical protein